MRATRQPCQASHGRWSTRRTFMCVGSAVIRSYRYIKINDVRWHIARRAKTPTQYHFTLP